MIGGVRERRSRLISRHRAARAGSIDQSRASRLQHSPRKRSHSATLVIARALISGSLLLQGQNAKCPYICTKNEFDLIMLHEGRAGPISISVTKRERVGRSISGCGPERRENHEYGFESGDCQDLSIPGRRPRRPANVVHERDQAAPILRPASAKSPVAPAGITKPPSRNRNRCANRDAASGFDAGALPDFSATSNAERGSKQNVSGLFHVGRGLSAMSSAQNIA